MEKVSKKSMIITERSLNWKNLHEKDKDTKIMLVSWFTTYLQDVSNLHV